MKTLLFFSLILLTGCVEAIDVPYSAFNTNEFVVQPQNAYIGIQGGGAGQTPWNQNIVGDGYNLSDVGTVSALYFSGNGGELTGIPLTALNQSGATLNQVPQWNGTSWAAATISGGGSQTPWTGPINGAGYSLTNAFLTNIWDMVTTNLTVVDNAIVDGTLLANGATNIGTFT